MRTTQYLSWAHLPLCFKDFTMKNNLLIIFLIATTLNNYVQPTAKRRNLQARITHLRLLNESLLQKIDKKPADCPTKPPTLSLCPTQPPKGQGRGSREKKRLQNIVAALTYQNMCIHKKQ